MILKNDIKIEIRNSGISAREQCLDMRRVIHFGFHVIGFHSENAQNTQIYYGLILKLESVCAYMHDDKLDETHTQINLTVFTHFSATLIEDIYLA